MSASRGLLRTALLAIVLAVTIPLSQAAPDDPVRISEIRIDHTGEDLQEYFELAGPPGSSLNGLTYVVIGDSSGGSGCIEASIDLDGYSIPASGYFVVAEDTFTLGTADHVHNLNFENSDNVTHLLVRGFTAHDGVDLDTNNDGILDSRPWDDLLDLIALVEEENPPVGTEYHYGPPSIGPDGAYVPGHVYRCQGGWEIGPFDVAEGEDTPGAPNPCGGSTAQLVINEIDYDQPGTDDAEFIEIKNVGGNAVNLAGYRLDLVNGNGDAVYQSIDLPEMNLSPGDYYVVCGIADHVPNCDLDVEPDTNLVQNGAPDAVALMREELIVDTVSYEGDTGAPYTEGSGAGLEDSPDFSYRSISRCPDGSDSDQNNVDFKPRAVSPGLENHCAEPFTCGDPATSIHDVQGSGASSPLVVTLGVIIEGVVVGDFQDTAAQLGGFFVQEEEADADADPATSEGVFVYDDGFGVDVQPGDIVRVQGNVVEYYGLTELSSVSNVLVCSQGSSVAPTPVDLPLANLGEWERYEGMLLTFSETLYATDTYNVGRYGEILLSAEDRLYTPTNVVLPGPAAISLQDLNDRSQILLDDGSTVQNPAIVPYLAADHTLRLGDTVTGLTGVLDYSFSIYRLHPTEPLSFRRENQRTPALANGDCGLKVASLNVLNYFNGDGLGGGFPTTRGASSPAELDRQREKLVDAILGLDADIIGLMELENDGYRPGSAIRELLDALNAAPSVHTYATIASGAAFLGVDEITVGLIYRTEAVTPVGPAATIALYPFDPVDNRNRQPLLQTFEDNNTGERLSVVVNHFKSKGGCPSDGSLNEDQGDGQGCWNELRTEAANQLANWLTFNPPGDSDPDIFIIGDLNAYAMEDPIAALKAKGYTDLIDAYVAPNAYTYTYMGQAGYLDHALASPSLTRQVLSAGIWHINADEPRSLDYNDDIQDPDEWVGSINPAYLYSPDAYRSSDHDPVLVCLDLGLEEVYMPLVETRD